MIQPLTLRAGSFTVIHVSREAKTKTCRCGRGKIFTDHRSMFNGKDSQGRQVCAECVLEAVLAPFVNKD